MNKNRIFKNGVFSVTINRVIGYSVWLFFIALILHCIEHQNPFDPDNKQTHGKPFDLQAEPYFGSINLYWKPLMLQDGTPMKFDSYCIYRRQKGMGWSNRIMTRETSFQDTCTKYNEEYYYKVSAIRGLIESDRSDSVSSFAYWCPRRLDVIGTFQDFPDPRDLSFCPLCQVAYLACYIKSGNQNVLAVIHRDNAIEHISIGKSPICVDHWHNAGEDTVLVCNNGELSVSVVAKDSSAHLKEIKRIDLNGNPLSIQISCKLGLAFVSIENTKSIAIIDLKKLIVKNYLVTLFPNPQKLFLHDAKILIVAHESEDKISFIDVSCNNTINYLNVGDKPNDITIFSDQAIAYVSCANNSNLADIWAIDLNNYTEVSNRNIFLPKDEWENHAKSVEVVPVTPEEALLFIAVWSGGIGIQKSRIFAYHLGKEKNTLIDIKTIADDTPRLARFINYLNNPNLFILNWHGLYSYY